MTLKVDDPLTAAAEISQLIEEMQAARDSGRGLARKVAASTLTRLKETADDQEGGEKTHTGVNLSLPSTAWADSATRQCAA